MSEPTPPSVRTPCLCHALRKASRAVSRVYDDEMRSVGLRTTQFSLLVYLSRIGEVRQGDLGELMLLEDTTVTRNIRPLLNSGWVTIRAGTDRREKLVAITAAGRSKLLEAQPAWTRAQSRMKSVLPEDQWQNLVNVLPDVAQAAAKLAP
ncbi:MarR family winged helix-turn-helix transcriptional regulator [Schlesneria paludicola]|uniref:MarR family winged helix-turn-helix transcriptional regulator n=1 Tax=Schlesneria paludicola TaxID=360056 RepID=UPI0004923922|nr:MarR family winged helix-turn-helix transcriptional regulator [Schlesneria paludicola]